MFLFLHASKPSYSQAFWGTSKWTIPSTVKLNSIVMADYVNSFRPHDSPVDISRIRWNLSRFSREISAKLRGILFSGNSWGTSGQRRVFGKFGVWDGFGQGASQCLCASGHVVGCPKHGQNVGRGGACRHFGAIQAAFWTKLLKSEKHFGKYHGSGCNCLSEIS